MAAKPTALRRTFNRILRRDPQLLGEELFHLCAVTHAQDAREEAKLCADIDRLVKQGAVIDFRGDSGQTPLFLLAEAGCAKAAESLIACGANVEAAGLGGVTPLIRAAGNLDARMLDMLLTHGAKVSAMTNNGTDAEYVVYSRAKNNHAAGVECLKVLIDHGLALVPLIEKDIYNNRDYLAPAVPGVKDAVALRDAVTARDNEKIKEILATGVDPDICVRYGDNASLIYASTVNNIEGMKLLIDAGADVDRASPLVEKTPLLNAATHGKKEACKLLLESGADPYLEYKPGRVGGDAFDFASRSGTPGLADDMYRIVEEREWRAAHPPAPDVTTAHSVTVGKPLQLKAPS